jgi:hypothetical protein
MMSHVSFSGRIHALRAHLQHQIEEGKDEDPDQIDKMPINPGIVEHRKAMVALILPVIQTG